MPRTRADRRIDRQVDHRTRTALKWIALLAILFWVAVILFRIVLMASPAAATSSFT